VIEGEPSDIFTVEGESPSRSPQLHLAYTDAHLLLSVRSRLEAGIVGAVFVWPESTEAYVKGRVLLDPAMNATLRYETSDGPFSYELTSVGEGRVNADALALSLVDKKGGCQPRHVMVEDIRDVLRAKGRATVYPGRPVMVSGIVRDGSGLPSPTELVLSAASRRQATVRVTTESPHGIGWESTWLPKTPLFALGLWERGGEDPAMRAAALMF
jgi:hypothetical protein